MRSSSRVAKTIAAVVGLTILVVGLGYTATREVRYESSASLLLTPTVTDRDVLPGVLESFTRSATANTYVELIASADTIRSAGATAVDVRVRAVPDSRVIQVSAEGDEQRVRPSLNDVIEAAKSREQTLRDVWALEQLEQPTAPEATGAPAAYLIAGTVLLALLGAGIVLVSLRRFSGAGLSAPPVIETRDDRMRQPLEAPAAARRR